MLRAAALLIAAAGVSARLLPAAASAADPEACASRASDAGAAVREAGASLSGTEAGSPVRQFPGEFPLPQIPAVLRTPAERASYLIEHYWDCMEFTDTLCSRNRDFMEQQFVNFVDLFPLAGPDARVRAADNLMERAGADSTAFMLLADIAERYLYDPNSPMQNEEYCILFLEAVVRSPIPGEYGRLRPEYLLRCARKNRPGMSAADFGYLDRAGRRRTLYTTGADAPLLLLFYDPDCSHCREIMRDIADDVLLNEAVRENRLTILAIYSDGDREVWNESRNDLPSGWIVGFDTEGIQERGLYVLRAMPTLYLLDGAHRVVLKDASPEAVRAAVAAGGQAF